MMNEFLIGGFAKSIAGHDSGQYYVIINLDDEYAYLVDGKIRTLDRPKKKKRKHIILPEQFDPELSDKMIRQTIKNEEIKRAIKLLMRNQEFNCEAGKEDK